MEQDQIKELRELVEFLKANGIAEFEMERADQKVGIKFAGATAVTSTATAPAQPLHGHAAEMSASGGSTASMAACQAIQALASAPVEEMLHEVKSPHCRNILRIAVAWGSALREDGRPSRGGSGALHCGSDEAHE